ncbi:serine/threonine-protein kinase [Prauserella flavalba]|uniref:Protein kinase domain-containing protein n=1 Tax=Prauserella flavalba TaxID=1477506 RepID=A0A318LBH4_9PSEU|nr:serine/threonine-protein kinase [Prauserella flavalba]PXY20559.1 hypothetical protein BA062_32565 [Prauserella flavalba]
MRALRPDEAGPIGRYRPVAAVGEGGMGRVLLALAPDGRLAAVKQIHPEFAHDPGFRDRFAHEVDVSRRVSGAYTAAVMDADPAAEAPWLASVYVAGPSLREAVEAAGPLPPASLKYLAAGLAAALADIHRAGLIHRDLKPSNVLLTSDGPRVIDFGIARAVEGSDLTSTGAVIGSPSFMSPEQAESAQLTPASDVFSLGALLVMAATGHGPFTGETAPQTLYNVVHAKPDLSALPPEIRALAEPCLAKDPARRPTPEQILDFLGPVTPGASPWPFAVGQLIARQEAEVRAVLSWPAPLPPVPPPAPRRRPWAIAALGAAAVLAVGTIVAVNLGGDEQQPTTPQATRLPVERALSADRLRGTDPCAVLDGARVQGAGVLTAGEEPLYLNRCTYETADGEQLKLIIGEPVEATGAEAGTGIAGRPVLLSGLTGGCEATIQLPNERELGIRTEDSSGGSCERAQAALRVTVQRLRDRAGEWDLPSDSAVPVDPCSLVDDARAREVLGPVTKTTLTRLHECEWTAGGSLSLTVEQSYPGILPEEGYRPVDLSGVRAYVREVSPESCALTWDHRDLDADRTENVRIAYHAGRAGGVCQKAQAFAKAAIKGLRDS